MFGDPIVLHPIAELAGVEAPTHTFVEPGVSEDHGLDEAELLTQVNTRAKSHTKLKGKQAKNIGDHLDTALS